MKFNNIMALFAASVTSTAFALEAPKTNTYQAQGKLIDIVNPTEHCPINAMCEIRSFARVQITFAHCTDKLIGVQYDVQKKNIPMGPMLPAFQTKYTVKIGAIAITDLDLASRSRCAREQTKIINIPMGLGFISKSQTEVLPLQFVPYNK